MSATSIDRHAYARYVAARPTEMLVRQLDANRKAAREWVDNGKGRKWKGFAHVMPFRPHFVLEILAMRRELKNRLIDGVSSNPQDGGKA